MARDLTPALKRCRYLGIEPSVLGLTKKPSIRQPKRARKLSEYALQLKEKQKAKFIYGVLEAQFYNYFKKILKQPGIKGENLLIMLERRLDNVMFRLGYGRTRAESRQLVLHNHILVNGKKVNIPSYIMSAGDTIEIREKSRSSTRFDDILARTQHYAVPAWLRADVNAWQGEVVTLPTRDQIDVPINETLIVELYSK